MMYPFLSHIPKDFLRRKHHHFPLLLSLHGSGECGKDLARVAKQGPLAEAEAGRELPFVIIAPQAEKEQWDPQGLTALLDRVEHGFRIDRRRVYLTGYSMGADGVWALAMHTPHRFAAIAPLCGGGDVRKVKRLVQLPIWDFHGAKDPVVSIRESEELITALRAARARHVRFTVYPDAGHDIWTRTYKNPELYHWLLTNHR